MVTWAKRNRELVWIGVVALALLALSAAPGLDVEIKGIEWGDPPLQAQGYPVPTATRTPTPAPVAGLYPVPAGMPTALIASLPYTTTIYGIQTALAPGGSFGTPDAWISDRMQWHAEDIAVVPFVPAGLVEAPPNTWLAEGDLEAFLTNYQTTYGDTLALQGVFLGPCTDSPTTSRCAQAYLISGSAGGLVAAPVTPVPTKTLRPLATGTPVFTDIDAIMRPVYGPAPTSIPVDAMLWWLSPNATPEIYAVMYSDDFHSTIHDLVGPLGKYHALR